MHPAQIKAHLQMAGYTQVDVAEQLRVAPNTVGYVVNGRGRSRTVENRIAVLIGKAPQEIWPQWYGKDGAPIRTRRQRVSAQELAARASERLAAAGGR